MSAADRRAMLAFQAIAQTLQREGWTIHDRQLLRRGDLLLCLGVSQWHAEHHAGYQHTRMVVDDLGACEVCGGTGEHPQFRHITFEWASSNCPEFRTFSIATFGVDSGEPSRASFTESGVWKCSARDGRSVCTDGRRKRARTVPDGDPLPTFHATPKGSNWHLERGGEIVAKGRIACGFDWRTPEHPEWEDFAAYTKAMAMIRRGIQRASA